ncbi:tetratricopeptide repeat protein [Hymenobacter sp. GOD-10R]|uniref:tetratricopeptide repeat protein n=1 Tax=Hymenobacter sp. GOD-10R TaxID=3093922 RepID=UPI002D79358C|nr:tetratricopeptide repeat protein [Hymenobacter sp. GOD-10R]WRQ28140.1 tetratricopeptide repeat protein [Hymenobacter sp. GOD-10R]
MNTLQKVIFISCVSNEFAQHRLRLANQLGTLIGEPFTIVVQEDFQQGDTSLLERLDNGVRNSDIVIHLVGTSAGAGPSTQHVERLYSNWQEPLPSPLPTRSYTQWEYWLARRYSKSIFVYFQVLPSTQSIEQELEKSQDYISQQEHRTAIRENGEHRKNFINTFQLVKEVFYDLGLGPSAKINNLPYGSLGNLFKGRDSFLQEINKTFGGITFQGHQRIAAITTQAKTATMHGLGGIGKTRAAIEYAHMFENEYTAILFVVADSVATLFANIAALCNTLKLQEQTENDQEVRLRAVLQWLQQHPGWLLILDNVDTDETALAVEKMLGQIHSAGQVLITSRLRNWSGAIVPLEMNVLDVSDATDFLLERTDIHRRKSADDQICAEAIACDLGQLALALEQAGAYIATNRLTLKRYREKWLANHESVITWYDERLMQYPRSIATTWLTSFNLLSESARILLNRLAWLAPEPVPETLLELSVPEIRSIDALEALTDLDRYSLVTRLKDTPSFSIHRLVQDVTRCQLNHEHSLVVLSESLKWIKEGFVKDPQDVRNWPILEPLAPHLSILAQQADNTGLVEHASELYNTLGNYLLEKVQFTEAKRVLLRALTLSEERLGHHHSDLTAILNNLARASEELGELDEAESILYRAISIIDDHPNERDESIYVHNLSRVIFDINHSRAEEAEALSRRSLAIRERIDGENASTVATCLSQLATILRGSDRLLQAISIMLRALNIDRENFGKCHPRVALRLNSLAYASKDTGHWRRAELFMRRAFAINEDHYGPDDPRVALSLSNLVHMLPLAKLSTEGEMLASRAITIFEQVYGPNHPKVSLALDVLGYVFRRTNHFDKAEPLVHRALAILIDYQKQTGYEHPNYLGEYRTYRGILKKLGKNEAEIEEIIQKMTGGLS